MAVRVRQSPFGGGGDGGGVPNGSAHGQGLTQAPTPPARPAPVGTPNPDLNFDFFDDQSWGAGAAEPTQPSMRVAAPQAQQGFQQQGFQQPGFPQQQQAPQQGFQQQQQQPQGFQQQGFQQQQQAPQQGFQQQQQQPQGFQQQGFPQQAPQQQMPQQGQPGQMPQMPQEMGQMLAGGMGAMGMNSMMADVVAGQLQDQFKQQIVNQGGILAMFPAIFLSLQQLFSVGHSFVIRKLLLLLCPFITRKEGAAPANNVWGGEASPGAQPAAAGADGLKTDIEEADGYIPAMAYTTYVLLYGVHRGMLKEFQAQDLSNASSFGLVLLFLEVGGFYMAFYITGNTVPALQLAANCGYKYVSCVLMVLARIATGGHNLYYLFFFYFAACAGWSIRRFMLRLEPSQVRQQYGVPTSPLTKHIITVMAGVQFPICFILLRGT